MRTNRASEERHATALSSIVDLRSSKPASAQDAVERAGSVALLARDCVQDKVLLSLHATSRPRTVAEYCWCHSNTTSLIPSRMVLRHYAEAPLPAARSRFRRQRRPSVALACPPHPTVRPQAPLAPGAASRSVPNPYKVRAIAKEWEGCAIHLTKTLPEIGKPPAGTVIASQAPQASI